MTRPAIFQENVRKENRSPAFIPGMRMLLARAGLWHRNHHTRRRLAWLDHDQLADISVSAGDRRIECRKWFWQV